MIKFQDKIEELESRIMFHKDKTVALQCKLKKLKFNEISRQFHKLGITVKEVEDTNFSTIEVAKLIKRKVAKIDKLAQ